MGAPVLSIRNGGSVQLSITGYEFRSPKPDKYDSNWLLVHGTVQTREWRHEFHDPCLLTWEAAELIAWIRGVPSPPSPEFSGIEPLIHLEHNTQNPWEPILRLKGEALPNHYPDATRWGDGISIALRICEGNRDALCDQLEAELEQHPRR